jgi:hypothetical protein
MNFRVEMSHQEVLDHCKDSKYLELLVKDEFRIRQKITGKNFFFYKLFYS